jgi:hypothetical protein
MRLGVFLRAVVFPVACLIALQALEANAANAAREPMAEKTRLAIIGLDHDHVWELLKYLETEPEAELVAIAEAQPALVKEAESKVPASVKFYSEYVKMLDEVKPEAVIVTTANDRHL